ncbi:MAG: hypothetical protein Q8876_02610 [Bacillota bacterium]|nr:hypothetical protein [Bacillota bacterium]
MGKFCVHCGIPIPEGGVCNCAEAVQERESQATNQADTQPPFQNIPPQQGTYQQPIPPVGQPIVSNNSKLYKILSYISILWIIGLVVSPEKNQPSVRFHVGQGIVLTIFSVVLKIVVTIINAIVNAIIQGVFITRVGFGYAYYSTPSAFAICISGLFSFLAWAAVITLAIIGIVNVVNEKDKELPFIGRFAFYK